MQYRVVLTGDSESTVWPVDEPLPGGWREEGKVGSKEECLDYINESEERDVDRGSPWRGFRRLWTVRGYRIWDGRRLGRDEPGPGDR